MSEPLVVLGATGSIGTQALEVATNLSLDVEVIAARRPSPELAALAALHPDARVVVAGGAGEERHNFTKSVAAPVSYGPEAIVEAAGATGRIVLNAIVGAAGLRATVAALEAGNRVALANKESLVAGGEVVMRALLRGGGELLPVDSEHSALHQCLIGEDRASVSRLMLTASGGPFRGKTIEQLADVTPDQALRHPTWNMGDRITIDSATMFNKGLEIVEAHHLFGVPYDNIDVLIHPQSILHSAVEFSDGSWKGHLGHPDMRIPIQYALTAPGRRPSPASLFDLAGLELTFEKPDRETFPAIDIAFAAGRAGGSSPAVMNAADEVAVEAFLRGRLGFLGISEVVSRTVDMIEWRRLDHIEEVIEVDREARAMAASLISGAC